MSPPNVFGGQGDTVLNAVAADFTRDLRNLIAPDTQVQGVSESETPETDAAARRIDQSNFEDSWKDDFEPYAWVTSDFARSLERRLRDTEKLLATYSAEREDFWDFLKELYNLSSFDWDSMPEDLRREFQGVLLRAIDEKLQTTYTP